MSKYLLEEAPAPIEPACSRLVRDDLQKAIKLLPLHVIHIMEKYNLILAGGYLRSRILNEKPNDIDLFGPNVEDMLRAGHELKDKWKGRLHETKNAITILAPGRIPVQFIKRWLFEKPTDIVNSFDFSIAAAVIWMSHLKDAEDAPKTYVWKSLCHYQFYGDLSARRLRYLTPTRSEDAGGSMMRVMKFLKRDYSISPESLSAVTARWAMGTFGVKNVYEEPELSKYLCALLREVDPLNLVDGVETLEEKIEAEVQPEIPGEREETNAENTESQTTTDAVPTTY